jgi:hypothetical protein
LAVEEPRRLLIQPQLGLQQLTHQLVLVKQSSNSLVLVPSQLELLDRVKSWSLVAVELVEAQDTQVVVEQVDCFTTRTLFSPLEH